MTLRRIDPAKYATAADAFDGVAVSADRMLASARSALATYARMAGDDPGGEQFATNYDSLAGIALQSFADISMRATTIDRALMASGAGHADADAALAGKPGAAAAFPLRPAQVPLCVASPPSAFGGDAGSTPGPWDLVKDLVGMMWPNADVGKLKHAATTWTTISHDFDALARQISQSDDAVSGLSSTELPRVTAEVADFASDVRETAGHVAEIASMCTEYATAVEEAHNEVIDMLTQLAIEIAATAGVSFALSFVTFGGAGAAGALLAAGRIATVAYRVGAVISRVFGIAGRIATRLILLYSRFVAFAARHATAAGRVIQVVSGAAGAGISDRVVLGSRGNTFAAVAGGALGGTVALKVAARFSGLGSTIVREALAEGSGGIAEGIVTGVVTGDVDPRSILINGAGGALFGGAFARAGRHGKVASAAPDGAAPHIADHAAPDIAGSDGPSVGAADAPALRTDYDGPQIGGSDVVGAHAGEGPSIHIPTGEAPTATDFDMAPPAHAGADAPAVHGGADAPAVHGGADAPVAHGGADAPGAHAGADAPAVHGGADAPAAHGAEHADPAHEGSAPDSADADVADAHATGAGDGDASAHSTLDADAPGSHDASAMLTGDPASASVTQAAPGPHDHSVLEPLSSGQQEIIAGTADHGPLGGDGRPTWTRVHESPKILAEVKAYNHPKRLSGVMDPDFRVSASDPIGRAAAHLRYDSQAWGHRGFGGPAHSEASWNGSYVDAARPGEQWGQMQFAPNAGAVPGTRVQYSSVDAFLSDFGNLRVDRLGALRGGYMGIGGGTFDARGLPIGQRAADDLWDVTFTKGAKLPDNMVIEISMIADAYGRDGGALQVVVRRTDVPDLSNESTVPLADLMDPTTGILSVRDAFASAAN